ncbi:MAG: hypothetical protein GYB20_04255 [Oceanospirillales bacterium]|nr:hypothetical protein [Oceanospirillales bacterium]MBR9886893.1 hypothetical protein [Oceanospirillales bacterium]
MDASFKSRCSWLVVCCSKKLTQQVTAYSTLQCLIAILTVSPFISISVQANPLIDTYVKFNQNLTYAIMKPMRDSMGVALESVNVEYRNQPVSFQYQMWRLRPNSVCQPQKYSLLKYSSCTEAASQFFRETCQTLQQNPTDLLLYPNYKRLYCNAAASYQPVIAKVRRSEPMDERTQQRQQCSMLTIKAARTRKTIDIYERDKACGGDT